MSEESATRVWRHPTTLLSIIGVGIALALTALSIALGDYPIIGLWVVIGVALAAVGYGSWVTKDD